MRRWGAMVVLVGVAGCATVAAPVRDETPLQPFQIGTEDVIEVTVYRDPELTRTVPVRPDGLISLPIAGEVQAAGRRPEELRLEIVKRLAPYVLDPTVVSVVVREVHSARFYVVGEVGKPGAFPLQGRVTALQALALAGGLGEFSRRSQVTVVRADSDERVTVGLDDLWNGTSRVLLRPGDTLVVP